MPSGSTQSPTIHVHKIRDIQLSGWKDQIRGRWHYDDLAADPAWRHGWISIDAVTWHADRAKVYLGINSIDGDLLYQYDPATEQLESLGTTRWADAYDAKIHRALLIDPRDQTLCFGTSLLHDANLQHEAPGGKLVRYDPKTDRYDVLAIPIPHQYIQSIAADFDREFVYGFTYPAEHLFKHCLKTGETAQLAYVGNSLRMAQPHNGVVDANGVLWGTYAEIRAWDDTVGQDPIRLFAYHPDEDCFDWREKGLSRVSDTEQLVTNPPWAEDVQRSVGTTHHQSQDHGYCDGMVYDGDRFIYAGTVAGVLCRIDVQTGEVLKIADVMPEGRLPALGFDGSGRLVGAGGTRGATRVFRFDPAYERFELGPELVDPVSGTRPERIHELAVSDQGHVYLGENDNHERSSYLWEIRGWL